MYQNLGLWLKFLSSPSFLKSFSPARLGNGGYALLVEITGGTPENFPKKYLFNIPPCLLILFDQKEFTLYI